MIDASKPAIRPYRDHDRDQLVAMCLRTNRGRVTDLDLLPDVLVRPYLAADPGLSVVAHDQARPAGEDVVGYILGTADTAAFADWLAESWLPRVAHKHPLPADRSVTEPATLTEHWTVLLHTPRDWLVRPELLAAGPRRAQRGRTTADQCRRLTVPVPRSRTSVASPSPPTFRAVRGPPRPGPATPVPW